ncbi:hypothetical protein SPHINGO361_130156 [Sphingomonas sp. EC-HK361]|nr:hypothetical protein SPHINGO361_130156 [Sphingomonas sp. EC-HK361]
MQDFKYRGLSRSFIARNDIASTVNEV